jgi:hypothetical protein
MSAEGREVNVDEEIRSAGERTPQIFGRATGAGKIGD